MSSNTKSTNNGSYFQFRHISWRKFATFLAVANVVTIAVPWAIYGLTMVMRTGESGWGYALLLFTLWGLGGVIVFVNVVAALVYLVTHKPTGKFFWFSILTLLASATYFVVMFGRWLFR